MLGFLIASVNTAFFDIGSDMNALAGSVRQTDTCLRDYGAETDPLRTQLQRWVAGAIAIAWSTEPVGSGDYPSRLAAGPGIESVELENTLQRVRIGIVRLDPQDPPHQQMAVLCSADLFKLLDWRGS